jgi:hypothetical protein
MLDVFGSTELETIAKEVENTVRDIVENAAEG